MWDFDKKKMCGVKPHIGIGTMKKMSNLICGKFTAGRNYNLTLNNVQINGKQSFKLTFEEIQNIAAIAIDHSFLKYKKELIDYGYEVEINLHKFYVQKDILS